MKLDVWIDIIKGKFLVDKNSIENWRFIIFLTSMALISIAASHQTQNKAIQIKKLHVEVSHLKEEYIRYRTTIMNMQEEEVISSRVKKFGLTLPDKPPTKIVVKVDINHE